MKEREKIDFSKGTTEEKRDGGHGKDREDTQEKEIATYGGKTRIFQNQRLESMYCVGEGINGSEDFYPLWKGVGRIDRTTGEKQHGIEHAENGPGTRGSLTLTIIRIIMLMRASSWPFLTVSP